ncbi:hypothetical protein ACHAPT_011190 [Fusarium lateritium]
MTLQGPNNGFDEMVESAKSFYQGGSVPSFEESDKTAVLSGHLINVRMPAAEAIHFKAMIDFQWAMIVVAVFSGAAGEPELLPDLEVELELWTVEWEEPESRTMGWVEAQAQGATP